MTQGARTFSAEYLDRDEDSRFRSWHGLPDPSLPYFTRNGISTDELMNSPFVDCSVSALLKRLANDDDIDDQKLVDTLACALFCDDPSFTAYNALVLLEHFKNARIEHGMTPNVFASAVSGLSFHNGPSGNTGMHRLSDPIEIAGVAAVVRFIGTMNQDRLVRNTTIQHFASSGQRELVIANRHLDRLLRLNPASFETACDYLRKSKITTTRKSLQPLVERLEADGVTVIGLDVASWRIA
jgi:hypothetical protein